MSALVQPEWDMVTSVHEAAEMHAMARAVSGSAIYVSDKPGEHDFALLARVVLPDGSVLRARGAARPTRDCLFSDVLRDGTSLLKAWNTNAYTGVVGVFHLQGSSWDRVKRKFITHDAAPAQLSTQVRPCDVEGLLPSEGLQLAAAYAFTSKTLRLLRADEALTVSLSSTTGEVVAIAPVVEADGVRFAPLGLCEMYNGGGAVHACAAHPAGGLRVGRGSIDGVATTTTFDVAVRAGGRFLAYCSRAPASVKADGSSVAFTYDAATCALHVQVPLCAGLAQLAVAV
ncbi:hypothetical protein FOA52_014415 [Chlamydomonas sp. UWO 241]|nr:hypothetical protein FOA52_014415 [Chlamydomonas sp. UWO 241]